MTAQHLRLTIQSGYDLFCAIYKTVVMGTEASSMDRNKSPSSFGQARARLTGTAGDDDTGQFGGFTFGAGNGNANRTGNSAKNKRLENRPAFRFGEDAAEDSEDEAEDDDDDDVGGGSEIMPSNGVKFQSTFRVPTSKKVRLTSNSENNAAPAPTSMIPDSDDESLAHGNNGLIDDDEEYAGVIPVGGGSDVTPFEDEDENAPGVTWNPQLPRPNLAETIDDENDMSAYAERFGF